MSDEQVKAAVRARDDHRCTRCGITAAEHKAQTGRRLEVHRLVPGSPYTLEGCVTLCRKCHGPQPRRPWGTSGKPPRLAVDVDLVVKLAIKLRILRSPGRPTISDMVNDALRRGLAEEIASLDCKPKEGGSK